MERLTPEEVDILCHAIGADAVKNRTRAKRKDYYYRNRYAIHEKHYSWDAVQRLTAAGLMVRGQPLSTADPTYRMYAVTNAGLKAIGVDPLSLDEEDRYAEGVTP